MSRIPIHKFRPQKKLPVCSICGRNFHYHTSVAERVALIVAITLAFVAVTMLAVFGFVVPFVQEAK